MIARATVAQAARRAIVVVATGAILVGGAWTVRTAAEWRGAEAPLDVAPVSATDIGDQLQAEQDRAAALEARLRDVTGQATDLQAALDAASSAVEGGTGDATQLQVKLETARDRLRRMQRQLREAQDRLDALQQAAARQAAINARARTVSAGAAGGGGGDDEREGDDD